MPDKAFTRQSRGMSWKVNDMSALLVRHSWGESKENRDITPPLGRRSPLKSEVRHSKGAVVFEVVVGIFVSW